MNIEMRHLRYFIAVAEAGNLSRAAQKLFIAQPPLSVQIRQLEEALGTSLFVRHPKGVHLTEAGEALLPEARALVERVGGLRAWIAGATPTRRLSLGFVPSAGSTVLPQLLAALRADDAGLQFELREMISSEQIDALASGQIDLGIARADTRHPRIATVVRILDPFCVAVAATHRLPRGGMADLRAYAEADFVAFTRHRGPAYFDQAIHLCAQAGFSPRIRYEASTVHGVLDLVGAGLGVALVPASCVLLATPRVRLRPLAMPQKSAVLTVLRRKAGTGTPWLVGEEGLQHIVDMFERLHDRTAAKLQG
ncbi:DNA-binding transcriptional LysR family regulator [Pseudacidovorax intermedius]|uniref:DNA-binding transcriptional LysR family regulator n=1 Tax=Pseudacidovorax intermedius TaxID=433924 RepID=A0A370FGB3_9BURK|nr:LysR family transcriptional regulator [Pseudacidovorax intermedius]RDI24343.1 DNA-binding transcriptional LysR family regulator [Pseudacidovorax intermedius]